MPVPLSWGRLIRPTAWTSDWNWLMRCQPGTGCYQHRERDMGPVVNLLGKASQLGRFKMTRRPHRQECNTKYIVVSSSIRSVNRTGRKEKYMLQPSGCKSKATHQVPRPRQVKLARQGKGPRISRRQDRVLKHSFPPDDVLPSTQAILGAWPPVTYKPGDLHPMTLETSWKT